MMLPNLVRLGSGDDKFKILNIDTHKIRILDSKPVSKEQGGKWKSPTLYERQHLRLTVGARVTPSWNPNSFAILSRPKEAEVALKHSSSDLVENLI